MLIGSRTAAQQRSGFLFTDRYFLLCTGRWISPCGGRIPYPPICCTIEHRLAGTHLVRRVGGRYPVRCCLMVHAVHPAGAAARTMAIGRGLRHLRMALWDAGGVSPAAAGGCFAPCAARVFRPLRRATKGSASGLRDLGCSLPVGKSGRREIFRQDKVRVRSHTVCMARNRSAVLAEKIRRAPQTHGR